MNKFSTIAGLNKTWTLAKEGNRILLYTVLAQSIGLSVLAYSMANRDERVVLVPPSITEKSVVGMSNADASYLQSFGVYVTTLIGNLTPKNINFVIDVLSQFISPESYAPIRKQLIALSKDASFKNWVGSTHFEPADVLYEADTKKVFVTGYMTDVNTTGKQTKTQLVYEMKIEIIHGKPVISNLISYTGSEPKTLKWLELHPDNAEAKE